MDKQEFKEYVLKNHITVNKAYIGEWCYMSNSLVSMSEQDFTNLIDQLDEPDEFDRVLLKHIKDIYNQYEYDYLPGFINDIKDGLAKLKEPEKPVVPEFVAEWIEECKRGLKSLYGALKGPGGDGKLEDWLFISPNQKTFARAWLDGYEVEKEKIYRVALPDGESKKKNALLALHRTQDGRIVINNMTKKTFMKNESSFLTEAEIKRNHAYLWEFAVPVEEEEE